MTLATFYFIFFFTKLILLQSLSENILFYDTIEGSVSQNIEKMFAPYYLRYIIKM